MALGARVAVKAGGLPGDDEMLAGFAEHRAEFAALVKSYQEFDTSDRQLMWNQLPGVVELSRKSRVSRVAESGAIWLPRPYSAESARYLHAVAVSDGAGYFALSRRYGSLKIELSDPRYGLRPMLVDGVLASAVWKEYFFFPEQPKIEHGMLWWPADVDGRLTRSERVFPSLNDYPPGWRRGECVFRPIDGKWFIRMCWGA